MNQKRARLIRKMIYGDHATKVTKYRYDENGCRRAVGLRVFYQRAKTQWTRNKTFDYSKVTHSRTPRQSNGKTLPHM